jgi:hypothetical protein
MGKAHPLGANPNFVDFIGEGPGSRTLAQALLDTERKGDALKEELEGLRLSRDKVFQAPPREWVEERLAQLKDVLERTPDRSGLILRKFLGPLRLEPTRGDNGQAVLYGSVFAQYPRPTRPTDCRCGTGRQFEFFALVEAAGIELSASALVSSPE